MTTKRNQHTDNINKINEKLDVLSQQLQEEYDPITNAMENVCEELAHAFSTEKRDFGTLFQASFPFLGQELNTFIGANCAFDIFQITDDQITNGWLVDLQDPSLPIEELENIKGDIEVYKDELKNLERSVGSQIDKIVTDVDKRAQNYLGQKSKQNEGKLQKKSALYNPLDASGMEQVEKFQLELQEEYQFLENTIQEARNHFLDVGDKAHDIIRKTCQQLTDILSLLKKEVDYLIEPINAPLEQEVPQEEEEEPTYPEDSIYPEANLTPNDFDDQPEEEVTRDIIRPSENDFDETPEQQEEPLPEEFHSEENHEDENEYDDYEEEEEELLNELPESEVGDIGPKEDEKIVIDPSLYVKITPPQEDDIDAPSSSTDLIPIVLPQVEEQPFDIPLAPELKTQEITKDDLVIKDDDFTLSTDSADEEKEEAPLDVSNYRFPSTVNKIPQAARGSAKRYPRQWTPIPTNEKLLIIGPFIVSLIVILVAVLLKISSNGETNLLSPLSPYLLTIWIITSLWGIILPLLSGWDYKWDSIFPTIVRQKTTQEDMSLEVLRFYPEPSENKILIDKKAVWDASKRKKLQYWKWTVGKECGYGVTVPTIRGSVRFVIDEWVDQDEWETSPLNVIKDINDAWYIEKPLFNAMKDLSKTSN